MVMDSSQVSLRLEQVKFLILWILCLHCRYCKRL